MRAFTLIEILVAIIVFALATGVIYGAHVLSQKAYLEGETSAELTQNGRVILERITREIRQAREIVTELLEEESEATSTITFEDGHLVVDYHYIHYYQDGNQVKREVVGYYFSGDETETLVAWDSEPPEGQTLETKILEEPVVVGEYVSSLRFWEPEIICIGLTTEKRGKTIDFSTQIWGRNL